MNNKDIATNFLKLAAAGMVDEAYEKYVDEDFIHHNAFYPSDRESLRQGMIESHKKMPNKIFKIYQVVAEDDLVVTYSLVKFAKDHLGFAVMHMVRIRDGKIVEMWDMGQPIERDSPNKKGMF